MTTDQATYTLDNTWEKAQRRLSLLESLYDPGTTARLTALGVDAGWRCLEIGAGGGSIARWLCDRVGPTGVVAAVDLEPCYLEADPRPNLEIHRRDILVDGVPGEGYDLIHARALLMHLPNREQLIADLLHRLRPGGVMLLEEADLYALSCSESSLYTEVWRQGALVAAKAGGDWYWARNLPANMTAAGLVDVKVVTDGHFCRGGDPWAELTAISWEQLTPLMVANGYGADLIAAAIAELTDPDRWFPACPIIAASGRRP
jgi:SAM-dependent methyltransferase